jgi:hypothetical protein
VNPELYKPDARRREWLEVEEERTGFVIIDDLAK